MKQIRLLLHVFILAGLAGILRYFLVSLFPGILPLAIINFVGIFLLVFFVKTLLPLKNWSEENLTALGVGFLGGFTTIASPLLDLVQFLLDKNYVTFLWYATLYVVGGIGVAFFAHYCARRYLELRKWK